MALHSGPINLSFPQVEWSLLGQVSRMLRPRAGPLAFLSCPLPNPDCWTDPSCLRTVDFWPYFLAGFFHPSLAILFHCSPPDLLLRLVSVTLLLGLPALPDPEVLAMPGKPLLPLGHPLLNTGTTWLTSWDISCWMATQAGDACPKEPVPFSLPLSHSRSLFSFPPPRVRAQQPLQLTLTKQTILFSLPESHKAG
jgi:hypothetical protein